MPELVPWLNLVLSIVGLVLILVALWRGWVIPQITAVGALAIALLVHAAGGMFQANLIPVWVWIITGTGGRAAIVVIVLRALWSKR